MEINVTNLKNKLFKLNKLIEEYEIILLNLNNQYININNFWNDNNATIFQELVTEEKNKINSTYLELVSIKELYLKLIDKYEKVAQKIYIHLNEKESVITNLNEQINKIDNLIKIYNNIDTSILGAEAELIINQKNKLINHNKSLKQYKTDIMNLFSEIIEIEKEINIDISKIDIQLIKENLFSI